MSQMQQYSMFQQHEQNVAAYHHWKVCGHMRALERSLLQMLQL